MKGLALFDRPPYSNFLLPVPFLSCLDLVGMMAMEELNSIDDGGVPHLGCLKVLQPVEVGLGILPQMIKH